MKRKAGDDSFVTFITEQLSSVDDLSVRPMFGAHGLYAGDTFFGIVCRGRLYLKTDAKTIAEYERRGMQPFRPNERQTIKSYYEVPADVVEDREQLSEWASRAVRANAKS